MILTMLCILTFPCSRNALQWNVGVISDNWRLETSLFYQSTLSALLNNASTASEADTTSDVTAISHFFAFLPNTTSFKALTTVCGLLEKHDISALISFVSCYSASALTSQTNSLGLPHILVGSNGGACTQRAWGSQGGGHTHLIRAILPSFPTPVRNRDSTKGVKKVGVKGQEARGGSQGSFTVSLSGQMDVLEEPLIELILMRQWSRIVLIHDTVMSSDFGDSRNVRFREKLAHANVFRYDIDSSRAEPADLDAELSSFNNSRNFENFVVIASSENCNRILDTAARYNLFKLTFNWVIACPDTPSVDLNIRRNNTLGNVIHFLPQKPFEVAEKSDLLLKVEKAFSTLLKTFQSSKTVPQSGSLRCGGTEKSQAWEQGQQIMAIMQPFHEESSQQLAQANLTNFDIFIFSTLNKTWTKEGVWSRKGGFNSSHPLLQPPKENYKRIRVVTVVESPFVEMEVRPTGPHFTGYCIDMLREIAKQMNFQYEIYNASEYGRLLPHSNTWVGAVGEVAYRRADMAVSGMLITSMREDAVDFSTRFMDYGVGILIKKSSSSKTVFGFLEPLDAHVWVCVAAAILIAGLMMFAITRMSPFARETRGDPETRCDFAKFSLHNSIWFTLSSIMQQGGDLHPRTSSARILGSFWWFFTLIITSTYTANLAAFLTVNRMETPIDSLQSLVSQNNIKYGTVKHSPIHLDFKDQSEMNPLYERIANYFEQNTDMDLVSTPEQGYLKVRQGNYAFMWDDPILQWMKATNCEYMTVGKAFLKKGYGIAVQKGTIFREEISKTILKLEESRTLEKLHKKWFEKPNSKCPTQEINSNGNAAKGIELSSVAGIFYVLVFGTLAAFLVGIAETFWHRRSVAKLKLARDLLYRGGGGRRYWRHEDALRRAAKANQSLAYLNTMAHETPCYNYPCSYPHVHSHPYTASSNDGRYLHKSVGGDFFLPDGCTLLPNGNTLPPATAPVGGCSHPLMDRSFPSSREDSLEITSLDPPYKAAISYCIPPIQETKHNGGSQKMEKEEMFTTSKEDSLSTVQNSPCSDLLRFRNTSGSTSNCQQGWHEIFHFFLLEK